MVNLEKYRSIIPAFYACYDKEDSVSPEHVRALIEYRIKKGVRSVYVSGSSGEYVYQSVEDRKTALENVMAVVKGKLTVIAHVAYNNTKDSVELAKHTESLGVDAIAVIPPTYFHLPGYAIAAYQNTMSEAAPNTDSITYNIPQLAGVALTQGLFAQVRQNPRVIGAKNSSMPVQGIQVFKAAAGKDYVIPNGPDEQFISGHTIGVEAGIGGIYGVMLGLLLKMDELVKAGKLEEVKEAQYAVNEVIYKMCSCRGNMYEVIKGMLRTNENLNLGRVGEPPPQLVEENLPIAREVARTVREAVSKYCQCSGITRGKTSSPLSGGMEGTGSDTADREGV